MLKKTIVYTNPFTNQPVSEEHYFHISKADLVEMEMEEHNASYVDKNGEKLTGMRAKLQRIVDSQDGKAILSELKDIIRRSYGRKDGDRFLKSQEIWDEFAATEAFSQLLFELCTDASAAGEFINGVVPSDLEQIAAEVRERTGQIKQTETSSNSDQPPRVLTQGEIKEMDSDELKSGLATGRYKLS